MHLYPELRRPLHPPRRQAGRPRLRIMLVAFMLWVVASSVLAGDLEDWTKMSKMMPKGYVCHHTDRPLVIDGRLDEKAWKSAPWSSEFTDIEGDTKPKPHFRTRVKMLWDNEYFYVGAELEEPHVWATLTQHDAVIFQDNDFEVFMDPNGDSHEYYEFEINALNTGWDLLLKKPYKDGGPALNEWEIPGLKTAVHINGTLNNAADTDAGWTVEIAFPWKALAEYARRKTPPAEGDQWRVNFSRVEWQTEVVDGKYQKMAGKKEDNWVWSPQGIIDLHRPEKWGYVQFTRKKAGRVDFAPDPAAEAKNQLHRTYYAQRDYREQHGHWANSLGELALDRAADGTGPVTLKSNATGFEVSAKIKLSNGNTQSWHIRQDARIWSD